MLFIFGMPRSGTTLLAQCLNAHSEIVIPHETDFIIPMAFILDRIKDQSIGRELIYNLIVNSTAFTRSLGEYLSIQTVHEIVYASKYTVTDILQALYQAVAKNENAKIAGDKSPNDLNFLRMLVKTGGLGANSKIIHIVRDIRDVMVSVNRAGWQADLDLYFPRFWNNQNLYLHQLYQHQTAKYKLVKYEALVSNPASEFLNICQFLGLEFEAEMLLSDKRNQRYRGQKAHTNLYNPISDASVGKYKSILDQSTLDNYLIQAGEALAKFGYL